MVKYEERATVDATAPFHRSKYFFSFFFFLESLFVFVPGLFGWFPFFFIPRASSWFN